MINKIADEKLPQDLQDAINTFIKQTSIVDEYKLDNMPIEYFINLINKLYDYKDYKTVMDLLEILESVVDVKRKKL
mgnify:FL=1